MSLDQSLFESMLSTYSSDSDKRDFIRKHAGRLPGLTFKDVMRLLPRISSDSYRKDVVKHFAPSARDGSDVCAALSQMSSESYQKDVVKLLCRHASLTKSDIIEICRNYFGDSYGKDIIKHFIHNFNASDVHVIMLLFSDSYKLDIVKMFNSNSRKFTIDDLVRMAKCIEDDDYRFKLLKLFAPSINTNTLSLLATTFKKEASIRRLVNEYTSVVQALSDCYNVLLKLMSDDAHRFSLLRTLVKVSISPSGFDFLRNFKDEDMILKAIIITNIHKVIDAVSLCSLLDFFADDQKKLSVFKRTIRDTDLEPTILRALAMFRSDDTRLRALNYFTQHSSYASQISDELVCDLLDLFTTQRLSVLSVVAKKTTVGNTQLLSNLLHKLGSVGDAAAFLKKRAVDCDMLSLLCAAGYDAGEAQNALAAAKAASDVADEHSDNDSESESESDDDDIDDTIEQEMIQLGISFDEDAGIMTMDRSNIQSKLPEMVRNFLDWSVPEIIEYDVNLGRVINFKNQFGMCTINGIDPAKEAQNEVKKQCKHMYARYKEAKKKKEQLKVPHAWKDQKLKEGDSKEDECMICLSRKKMILFFPCGHYHTCGHCTREIIRSSDKNLCPLCRREFTGITRVF